MKEDQIVMYVVGGLVVYLVAKDFFNSSGLFPTSAQAGTQQATGITGDYFGALNAVQTNNAQAAAPFFEDFLARLQTLQRFNPFNAGLAGLGVI